MSKMLRETMCAFCGQPLYRRKWESRLVVENGFGDTVYGHSKCWRKEQSRTAKTAIKGEQESGR